MAPVSPPEAANDPVELLDQALERAWEAVSAAYEVTGRPPDLDSLLDGVHFSHPKAASETILVNMLLEVMELTGRFSPWYRMPARAFGLSAVRDSTTNTIRRILAPEAAQKWAHLLDCLTQAIEKNSGLIQAVMLVDGLMLKATQEDPCVFAGCGCIPPRILRVRQSIFEKAEISCDACRQPFDLMSEDQRMDLRDLWRERRKRFMVNLKRPATIRQLLEARRDAAPISVSPQATVFEALKLMADRNVGAVTVHAESGEMVGIFSERDYARKIILMGRSSLETLIEDIMTPHTITIHPDQTLEEGLAVMSSHHIRHLPVVEAGHLTGLVSMRDLVAGIIHQKDSAIEKLEQYILSQEE